MLKEGDRLNELIMQKERLEYDMETNANAAEEGAEFDEARQFEIEAELAPSRQQTGVHVDPNGDIDHHALLAGDGFEIVPGPDAKALVSYLLSLKKDHKLPAALDFAPVKKAGS